MNLPDFMSYSNKFTNGDFIEKILENSKTCGSKIGLRFFKYCITLCKAIRFPLRIKLLLSVL